MCVGPFDWCTKPIYSKKKEGGKKKANKHKAEQIIVFAQNIKIMLEELCF